MLGSTKENESETHQELKGAFELFSDMSEQLAKTHQQLEMRIEELTGELEMVSHERLMELAEKESLAQRLQSLLHLLPGGVVVLDGKGRIVQSNLAALDFLGAPLDGLPWFQVIERAFAPRSDDGYEVSLKDGRRLSIATQSLADEPGQIILLTDLTETRALQSRLNRHERLSSMGEMVASLAHQIRTPLSTALLYTGHLQNSDLDEETRQRFAQKIMARLHHLESQINDMLLFAKGGDSVVTLVDLDELLISLQQLVEPQLAEAKQLKLVNTFPGRQIYGNRDALLGGLHNLVNNALEARANATITVLMEAMKETHVDITVQDNGPGIPENLREKILEPFFTTRTQGTGLGLAVVQAIAKAHKGILTLRSTVGEGSQFTLTLPCVNHPDKRNQ